MLSSDLSTNLKGGRGDSKKNISKYQCIYVVRKNFTIWSCLSQVIQTFYRIHKTFDFDIRESYQNSYNCKHLRFNVNISFVTFLKHNLLTPVTRPRTKERSQMKLEGKQIVRSKSDYELSLLWSLDSDLSPGKKYTRIRLYRTSSSPPPSPPLP